MPILNWLNKDQATQAAAACEYRLLAEVPELSCGDKDSGNLIVQGDNLQALKALIPHYAGQVKCIYIDPPYNTESAFEHYDDNLEHSLWLSTIYPRLELLWELLTDDGVILISINDDEAHYLKVVCDEIFGRNNFISSLVWHYEGNTDNQAKIINYHEYIFLYAKNGAVKKVNAIDPNIKTDSKLNKSEIRNTVVKNGPKNPISEIVLPKGFPAAFEKGTVDITKVNFPQYDRDIIIDNYKLVEDVVASSGWASKSILEQFIKNSFNSVLDSKEQDTKFELTKTGAIEVVKKRKQGKGHFISVLRGFGSTYKSNLQLKKMDLDFSYPKPVELIAYLISAFTEDNDIILDSFAGSGTTAHAVLMQNQREKVRRKFILVEMNENTAKNIISKRLNHVVNGYEKAKITKTGSGFRFCRLGGAVFDGDGNINRDIGFAQLAAHIWYLETKQPLAGTADNPLLGEFGERVYYLLFNGILGDRRPNGGNVLTNKILPDLPDFEHYQQQGKQMIIYGESCRLGTARLQALNVTFKQIPYDVGGA